MHHRNRIPIPHELLMKALEGVAKNLGVWDKTVAEYNAARAKRQAQKTAVTQCGRGT